MLITLTYTQKETLAFTSSVLSLTFTEYRAGPEHRGSMSF